MIPIKSVAQIEQMRVAGRIAANVLARMARMVEPGLNTYDLDQAGRKFIAEYGATSACFNYPHGNLRFPSYTCLSVNEEVVHGIGDLRRVLREGDVVSIDVSIVHDGWIGDNAATIAVGAVDPRVGELLRETKRALELAIEEARAGNRVGFISHAVEAHVVPKGFGVVRDFVGHGVGRPMHEPPQIPNFGPRKRGERLRPGMTLAIEPMITLGRSDIEMGADGWTAMTVDRSPAAHFEHTVLVTAGDPEILTLPDLD